MRGRFVEHHVPNFVIIPCLFHLLSNLSDVPFCFCFPEFYCFSPVSIAGLVSPQKELTGVCYLVTHHALGSIV